MAISINEIKYVRALAQKKYRQKYNKFVVEGDKMAREILESHQYKIDAIYARPIWIEANQALLSRYAAIVKPVSTKELDRISNLKTPNQVLTIAYQTEYSIRPKTMQSQICLYLDGIRDPGNLGTILRIADWFGIPYVFRSSDTVELYSPKVIQSSMGAFLRVDCPEFDLEELVDIFPKIPIFGAVMDGENVFKIKPPPNGIIVVGNEGKGISPENLSLIKHRITIPKGANGGAESLNVAVATGIICGAFLGGR